MSRRANILRRVLREPFAPRVVRGSDLPVLAEEEIPIQSLRRLGNDLTESEDLDRVRKGLYLNRLASPNVTLDEAAAYVRGGAIVSLQRVLGQCGALNNPWRVVTCVVPIGSTGSKAPERSVRLPGGDFEFYGVSERILMAGNEDDRLQPQSFACATPEAALLHWLYLSNMSKRSMSYPPPGDVDGDCFDLDRFNRLADAMGIAEIASDFAERMSFSSVDEEPSDLSGFDFRP